VFADAAEDIIVKHYLTGRARLFVPALKKDKNGFPWILARLKKLPGVKRAEVNFTTGRLLVYFEESLLSLGELVAFLRTVLAEETGERDSSGTRNNIPSPIRAVKEPEDLPVWRQVLNVALGGGVLGFWTLKHVLVGKSALAQSQRLFNLAAVTAIISGYPIFKSGLKNLAVKGRINHDLVMGALSLGILLMRESVPGLLVVWLVNLNSLFQSLALAHSRRIVEECLAGNGCGGEALLNEDAPSGLSPGTTPAEEYAEKIVPVSLGLAAAGAGATGQLNTALASLLAASPAPAGLARPGALGAAMALARKKGILVRRPAAFARLRDVDNLVFTGPGLPGCRPEVVEALPLPGFHKAELISVAEAAFQEYRLKDMEKEWPVSGEPPGGISASCGGRNILIGGKDYISSAGVSTYPALLKEKRLLLRRRNPLYVAVDGRLAGLLGLRPQIAAETRSAIYNLRSRGVSGIYIVAGEGDLAALSLASELGLTIIPALPEEGVADFIQELRRDGGVVAAVGHGPGGMEGLGNVDVRMVFKQAGGPCLKEADIILAGNNLDLAGEAVALSFIASERERRGVEITGVLNILGLVLALSRLLSPGGAAMYNNLISIAVSLNSLSMLRETGSAAGVGS